VPAVLQYETGVCTWRSEPLFRLYYRDFVLKKLKSINTGFSYHLLAHPVQWHKLIAFCGWGTGKSGLD